MTYGGLVRTLWGSCGNPVRGLWGPVGTEVNHHSNIVRVEPTHTILTKYIPPYPLPGQGHKYRSDLFVRVRDGRYNTCDGRHGGPAGPERPFHCAAKMCLLAHAHTTCPGASTLSLHDSFLVLRHFRCLQQWNPALCTFPNATLHVPETKRRRHTSRQSGHDCALTWPSTPGTHSRSGYRYSMRICHRRKMYTGR